MSTNLQEQKIAGPVSSAAEETLRLVAKLPAPDGLEDRIHKKLEAAPRRGRVLTWPKMLHPESGWMRGTAAAAIVFVIAGGGWGVYQRAEQQRTNPNGSGKLMVMPVAGGFGGAGAMREPKTLPGAKAPVATNPPRTQAKKPQAARQKAGGGAEPPAGDKTAGASAR